MPTQPQLVILGYSEAAMFLRGPRASDVRAILSIHGRREFGVVADVPHRLDLGFDDVEVPTSDDSLAMLRADARRRWAVSNGLVEVAPTPTDAAAIVALAERVRDVDGLVLCHCAAGMSRAPAVALICLAAWAEPGAEAACGDEVRRLRAGAVPHVGLVRFADKLLGRAGRLVAATAAKDMPVRAGSVSDGPNEQRTAVPGVRR